MRFTGEGDAAGIAAQLEAFVCTEERLPAPRLVESWQLQEGQYQVVALARWEGGASFLPLPPSQLLQPPTSAAGAAPLSPSFRQQCPAPHPPRAYLLLPPRPSSPITPYPSPHTHRHQRRQLLELQQFDGKRFWVALKELASNAACVLLAGSPALMPHCAQLRRPDALTAPRQQLLMVNSPEPVNLLVSLGMGMQHELRPDPPKEKLVGNCCAPACAWIRRWLLHFVAVRQLLTSLPPLRPAPICLFLHADPCACRPCALLRAVCPYTPIPVPAAPAPWLPAVCPSTPIPVPAAAVPVQVLVLTGPEGSGRRSLARQLLSSFPDKLALASRITTRAPHKAEAAATPDQGAALQFVSAADWQRARKGGRLAEQSQHMGEAYATLLPVRGWGTHGSGCRVVGSGCGFRAAGLGSGSLVGGCSLQGRGTTCAGAVEGDAPPPPLPGGM